MCGFIAQLVDHRTVTGGNWTGSNPVEALIFFQASSFQLLKLEKFTAMITLHFHLEPQYKYELFHIYFTYRPLCVCYANALRPRSYVAFLPGSVHFADPQSMDYPIWTTKWTTLMDYQMDYLDGLPIWTT